jgi:hypothetical protein
MLLMRACLATCLSCQGGDEALILPSAEDPRIEETIKVCSSLLINNLSVKGQEDLM